jgi:hypothetical protein
VDLDTDLIHITYNGTDPVSPLYRNIKHHIVLKFHKLHVMFNRESIVTVKQVIDEILVSLRTDDEAPAVEQAPVLDEWVEAAAMTAEERRQNEEEEEIATIKLDMHMSDLAWTLNRGGHAFAVMHYRNSYGCLDIRPRSWSIEGVFGNLSLIDTDPDTLFGDMIDIDGDSDMVSFRYETFSPLVPSRYPSYDRKLVVNVFRVKWIWMQQILAGTVSVKWIWMADSRPLCVRRAKR